MKRSLTDCDTFPDDMPRITLSLNQVGIIILWKSGVIYQHQTFGHSCIERCAEGVLILPTDPVLVTEIPQQLYQCPIDAGLRAMDWLRFSSGIDDIRADEIDKLLQSEGGTWNIAVDRTRLKESGEA